MGKRISNDTDETIIIEPGEEIDVRCEEETVRLMTARRKDIHIKEVREK